MTRKKEIPITGRIRNYTGADPPQAIQLTSILQSFTRPWIIRIEIILALWMVDLDDWEISDEMSFDKKHLRL